MDGQDLLVDFILPSVVNNTELVDREVQIETITTISWSLTGVHVWVSRMILLQSHI